SLPPRVCIARGPSMSLYRHAPTGRSINRARKGSSHRAQAGVHRRGHPSAWSSFDERSSESNPASQALQLWLRLAWLLSLSLQNRSPGDDLYESKSASKSVVTMTRINRSIEMLSVLPGAPGV